MSRLRKRAVGLTTLLAVVGCATTSFATERNFEAVPTTWMLQNYLTGQPQGIVIWRTDAPAPCAGWGGSSSKPFTFSNATENEANRLWSLMLTAQATNTKIGIWYDDQTCNMTSFYTVPPVN